MPTNPNKLTTAPLAPIRAATEALASGGTIRAWERAMLRAITNAHMAAYLAAVRDRTGTMPKGLSRAERTEVKGAIDTQLTYLAGFVRDLQGSRLSPAQAAARAALYAGAVRGTFYQRRYPGLRAYPGDGSTPCKGNCRCTLDETADGVYWRLSAAEHCAACAARAAGSPYQVRV
jgi:hypothetical protein